MKMTQSVGDNKSESTRQLQAHYNTYGHAWESEVYVWRLAIHHQPTDNLLLSLHIVYYDLPTFGDSGMPR